MAGCRYLHAALHSKTLFMKNQLSRSFFGIFVVMIIGGLAGCQKEFSTETGSVVSNSMAIYSFVPDAGICATITMSGASETGKAYATDNYVDILVEVTKKGDWSYHSAKINGIVFSGSGNFTDTGRQTIRIYGTGTPLLPGNFEYPIKSTANEQCSFSIITLPGGTPAGGGTNQNSTYYYKAEIGGVQYSQNVTATNGYEAGSGLGGVDDVSVSASIDADRSTVPFATSIEITKGLMHHYLAASNAEFKAFFAPGTYAFTKGPSFDRFRDGDGFYIYWQDKSGANWSTYYGSGDQTNSVIKIISVADVNAINGYYISVKLQFSCNLYNEDTGEKKILKNGEFVGVFGKI